MSNHCTELLPEKPEDYEDRIQKVIDFWNALRVSGDTGATIWEVLEPLERLVTEYLGCDSPDILWAESMTFKAALLIEGCSDL